MNPIRSLATLVMLAGSLLALAACGGGGDDTGLSGTIEIDGSSTVFPITQAVAEDFYILHPGARVNVSVSGTGGGFKRLITGETDISNASRRIKDAEAESAAANGVEFIEMRVATDGLSVLVNLDNDFVECLTVDELHLMWSPGSTINNWNQVRPSSPDQELRLYGPDTDSGTFDYFTEEINGESQVSRSDYTASADDNVLVQGVGGDKNALGYFGFAYYTENTDKLRAIAIDNGAGCVEPTVETIESGEYAPLSRPLFLYVNRASLDEELVAEFLRFYMGSAATLALEVGYVPAGDEVYLENLQAAGL
ncbi:MAG: PstS family phosphate ABC transporter substrate-binding protein [Chloroflexi bacterium]|nr:PstS family phosphate ABC transporter substrate-binding protein [Chloroflexota bacterium]